MRALIHLLLTRSVMRNMSELCSFFFFLTFRHQTVNTIRSSKFFFTFYSGIIYTAIESYVEIREKKKKKTIKRTVLFEIRIHLNTLGREDL